MTGPALGRNMNDAGGWWDGETHMRCDEGRKRGVGGLMDSNME